MNRFIMLIVIILIYYVSQTLAEAPTSDTQSSSGYLLLKVTGNNITKSDERTGVIINKSFITIEEKKLRLIYDIKVPPIDDFQFVLALDSSGSLGHGGDPAQGKAVIEAVPRFIEDTISSYSDKNFSISIISWDNNTDFAYSAFDKFDNKYPEKAKLGSIRKVAEDIRTEPVFGEVDDNNYYYRCQEIDHTNISEAINASITILRNNPPIEYHRTQRFIILVAGASEYNKCSDDLVKAAKELNCSVYVIGMGFNEDEPTEMLHHLERLSEIGDRNPAKIQCCKAMGNELKEDLYRALTNALQNATLEPVAENIEMDETFYGYIKPDKQASIEVMEKPNSFKKMKFECENYSQNKENKTTTITFRIPYGLRADTNARLFFDADFSLMDLPVSISENAESVTFGSASSNTNQTNFDYIWLRKYPIGFSLPSIKVNIESAATKKAIEPKPLSGEFMPMVLLSFVISFIIFKIKILYKK